MGRCRCRVVVGGVEVVVVETKLRDYRMDRPGRVRLMGHRGMLRMWEERSREGELVGVLWSR